MPRNRTYIYSFLFLLKGMSLKKILETFKIVLSTFWKIMYLCEHLRQLIEESNYVFVVRSMANIL